MRSRPARSIPRWRKRCTRPRSAPPGARPAAIPRRSSCGTRCRPPAAASSGGTIDLNSVTFEQLRAENLSVTQAINDRWNVYAGTTWTRWSQLEKITVKNSGVQPLLTGQFGEITEEQNWHDTWAYAIGTSYQLNKEWVLRTGLTFDQSPTNNVDRSPRIPTGDRTIVPARPRNWGSRADARPR